MSTVPTTVGLTGAGDFVTTTLNGAISSGATSMTIGTGLNIPASNGFLTIDYDSSTAVGSDNGPETVKYTSYTTGTGAVSGLTRGFDSNTTGVAHANGASVQCALSTGHLNNLLDIIENTAGGTWTVAATGYSGTPTTSNCRYFQMGKFVAVYIEITGTSNATTLTFALPVAAKKADAIYGTRVVDNSSGSNTPGCIILSAASTTATAYTTFNQAAWTAANTKTLIHTFWYEAN